MTRETTCVHFLLVEERKGASKLLGTSQDSVHILTLPGNNGTVSMMRLILAVVRKEDFVLTDIRTISILCGLAFVGLIARSGHSLSRIASLDGPSGPSLNEMRVATVGLVQRSSLELPRQCFNTCVIVKVRPPNVSGMTLWPE